MKKPPATRIDIKSLNELRNREAEIVARICATPNGGNLFLLHPMRLLREVGVVMTPPVEAAIRKLHPEIPDDTDDVYEALAKAPKQSVRITVEGLFRMPAKEARS